MTAPIALQLYSIREELSQDFEGGVRRIADMGYVGVEPAGFPGTTPEKAAALFKELGLAVPCVHAPLPVGKTKDQCLELMAVLGSKRIVAGLGPGNFETIEQVKRSCDTFNEASAVAAENGMSFAIHNHWWEFLQIDGQFVYRVMLDYLTPEVLFELDAYWAQTAGADPIAVLRELGPRAPLLHIKDGSCKIEEAMQPIGDGTMDVAGIVEAGGADLAWVIVELDRCDMDMMEALEKSYGYLTSKGLAQGRAK